MEKYLFLYSFLVFIYGAPLLVLLWVFFNLLKTEIFLFINVSFFRYFLSLFLSEEKERSRRKKEKETGAIIVRKLRSKSTSEVLRDKIIVCATISTKMLVKHSHFRDVLSVLRLILCFRVLREQLGRILFIKPLACLCERFSHYDRTRFFLLSLVTFFPFSSERKRERK